MSIKEISSITTTILTALGGGYAGLANIWGLPFANKIVQSVGVVVVLISAILGSFTIKKVSDRAGLKKSDKAVAPDTIEPSISDDEKVKPKAKTSYN